MVTSRRKMHKSKWTENPWTHLSYVPIPKFPHTYIKKYIIGGQRHSVYKSLSYNDPVTGTFCAMKIKPFYRVHFTWADKRHNMECFLSTLLNFNPFYFIFINAYVCICGNCIYVHIWRPEASIWRPLPSFVGRQFIFIETQSLIGLKFIESKLTGPQAKTISVFLPTLGI